MSFALLDATLRVVAGLLLGLLTIFFLRSGRRDDAPLVAALFCLSLIAFVVSSTRGATGWLGIGVYAFTALCVCKVVLFWMCCEALFADRFRMTAVHGVSVGAMAALGVWQAWADAPGHALAGTWMELSSTLLLNAATLGFIVAAPLSVFIGRRTDLDEPRRRIRGIVVPALAGYLSAVVIVQVAGFLLQQPTPRSLVLLNLVVICAGAAAGLASFVRIRIVNWLDQPLPVAATDSLSALERHVLGELRRRLVPERLYARDGLTIAELADLLGTQEHVLRRVVNQGLGFRNFSDFLHLHRLREAAIRLRDPQQARIPVLTIALEAGFGSIGPFNRAFKAHFGATPTQYRKGSNAAGATVVPGGLSDLGSPQTLR
jgi:AraC-like DNA-binding protein/cell division protein FtsW (lipid II flippase)